MPKFAANLSMLFTELPFKSRFTAARMAGFDAVEYLFPYDYPAEELQAELDLQGLRQVLFNAPPGDWEAGERGLAALPGREAQFESSISAAIHYAEALGCKQIHVMAGVLPPMADPERAAQTYVMNLKRAAEEALVHRLTLTVEPINHHDMPGYFLDSMEAGARTVETVGMPNVRLQFDIYHRQRMEGDVVKGLRDMMPIIGHIQIANTPGRGDPDHGELNYDYIFQAIDELAYEGWIGCEYKPINGTKDSLEWLRRRRKLKKMADA